MTEDAKGLSDLRFSWAAPGEADADGEPPLPPPAEPPADGGEHDPPAERYDPAWEEEWEAIEKASAESDNGELEIDVVDGVPRLARPGSLKAEANSLVHILTQIQEPLL